MQSSPIYQEIYDSQLGAGFKLEEADFNRAEFDRMEVAA